MATCEICGNEFDELGVQIVLPGLAKSFDRIDCAMRARALAGHPPLGVQSRAVLVDLGAEGTARAYPLGGLPAGLAAALSGRVRLALGSATVATALVVGTIVHLSSRDELTSEAAARSPSLAPPARYAADFADRTRTADAAAPAPQVRSPQQVRYVYLAAERTELATRPTRSAARAARVTSRTKRARSTRHAARLATATITSGGNSASTRRGWGWGDKNHSHNGPSRKAKATKKKKK
jgi:hypothetical protein